MGLVVTVSVIGTIELSDPSANDDGLKEAFAPVGSPETANVVAAGNFAFGGRRIKVTVKTAV